VASGPVRALLRRLRGWSARVATLAGGGRIAWSAQLLLERGATVRLGRGVHVRRQGTIVLEEDAALELGDGVSIMQGAEIVVTRRGRLVLGRDTYLGAYGNLRCAGSIEIGDHVRIAQFVSIIDANYHFRQRTAPEGEAVPSAVRIGAGAYLGAHVVVLPNVVIGEGAIVEAASVVTGDVPAFAIVVGNPAVVQGYRG
jgi:serine acetyltransferase